MNFGDDIIKQTAAGESALDQTVVNQAVVNQAAAILAKVPEVTVAFWLTKIAATTLGETAGDALSMSLNLGYLLSTGIFALIFLLAVAAQIRARQFHPLLYWFTIVATTTVGTTLADFADRSLHIGYTGGTALLTALLLLSLGLWRLRLGTVSIASVTTPGAEMFYWITIMFSQTLGTALGDWTADTQKFGYVGAAVVFGTILLIITALYFTTAFSRTALFWAAFVMTRPLGAVVGDYLDKPVPAGGLALDRGYASLALLVFMALVIVLSRPRAASSAH